MKWNIHPIFLTLILSVLVYGEAIGQKKIIGVELDVTADDSIKSDIESSVRRELRNLTDIDLYSTNPKYSIQIVAIEPSSFVALSVVVVRKYDFTTYITRELQNTTVTIKKKQDLIKTLAKNENVDQHFVLSNSANQLDEMCRRLVAKVDTDAFEPDRKFNALIDKYLDDSPAATPKTTAKPVSSGESLFTKEYVGGTYTLINVVNETDRKLTLVFGGITYSLTPRTQKEIKADGGRYEFSASVPNAKPIGGVTDFTKGYRYSWRFYIVRR